MDLPAPDVRASSILWESLQSSSWCYFSTNTLGKCTLSEVSGSGSGCFSFIAEEDNEGSKNQIRMLYLCRYPHTIFGAWQAIRMMRTETCFASPSHPILCEDRTRGWGWALWAVSYRRRPARAANIWQGWGQVLHSFAPPPANTNTALSSEDPHFWRVHRRFFGSRKSSSFIFGECQPQIVTIE